MASVVASDRHRTELLKTYENFIKTNHDLDRTLVSFQANRKRGIYNWLKYKEGFAARLVEHLIEEYGPNRGTLFDPFAGIGTSLFVARDCGLNAIGIELMPVGFLAVESRLCWQLAQPNGKRGQHAQQD